MNIDAIAARSRIIRRVRAFFDGLGFVEVDTPVRIDAPAPECNIDCPPVATGGFLRASPELQMKKLLASGMDMIYQIGPCFRDGERGDRHNPEFTMLEWYRKNAGYDDIARDTRELLASLGFDSPFVRLKVRDAYARFAGWDPWDGEWNQDRFDFDMATKVEPSLKGMGGVFLEDYPPQCASLARVADGRGAGEPLPRGARGAPQARRGGLSARRGVPWLCRAHGVRGRRGPWNRQARHDASRRTFHFVRPRRPLTRRGNKC